MYAVLLFVRSSCLYTNTAVILSFEFHLIKFSPNSLKSSLRSRILFHHTILTHDDVDVDSGVNLLN